MRTYQEALFGLRQQGQWRLDDMFLRPRKGHYGSARPLTLSGTGYDAVSTRVRSLPKTIENEACMQQIAKLACVGLFAAFSLRASPCPDEPKPGPRTPERLPAAMPSKRNLNLLPSSSAREWFHARRQAHAGGHPSAKGRVEEVPPAGGRKSRPRLSLVSESIERRRSH